MKRRDSIHWHQAFTLIELLIVVAIIGILAAIAVPNFLNAQTRAKVSRVLGDMRSLSTAIEMYSTDQGRAPVGSLEGVWTGRWTSAERQTLALLTSPIAYIAALPRDPFMESILASSQTDSVNRASFTYNCMQNPKWRSGNYQAAFDVGFTWYMFSPGPALTIAAPWPDYMIAANNPNSSVGVTPTTRLYESSNGVQSDGWLIWTNKGLYQ